MTVDASHAPLPPVPLPPASIVLVRGSSADLAEARRELSRYDARPWIDRLRELPATVVVTTRDRAVLPRKQRRLAKALGAPTFDVKGNHFAVAVKQEELLAALAAVCPARPGDVPLNGESPHEAGFGHQKIGQGRQGDVI